WKKGTKKLQIEHDGRSTTGTLKDVEGGEVVLLDTKGREMRLALAALDAEQILRRCTQGKLAGGAALVRAYAARPAGRRSRGGARARAAEADGAALESDAADWSSLLAQGEAAARVFRLAHAAPPVNDAQAVPLLADLEPLLAKGAQKEVATIVGPRRAALRKF